MHKRLAVVTVGCKSNFADSASIVREAVSAGFEIVPPARADADVVVVNSCTVTQRADRDSRAFVRRARRDHPQATVILTGCYARETGGGDSPGGIDYCIGPGDADSLRSILREIAGYAPPTVPPLSEHAADLLLGHRRTFLKIQDGCDFGCAYCVVPLARGASRSLPEREILEKAAAAEADGARELVLTGIHIGLYGADRGEKDALSGLVGRLLAATSRARLRLSSVEPMELTDALLERIGRERRVCPHLHIPLQSGCDRTLARMRRPYDARGYEETVRRAASRIAGVQVGADVIAGFPGERAADFEETVRFLERIPVHYLHVFPYSPREGTESGRWEDDVPAREKKDRVSRLLRLDAQKRTEFLRRLAGKELEVLAERAHPDRGELSGTSGNYVEVTFPGDEREVGGLFRVRATSVNGKGMAAIREERDD